MCCMVRLAPDLADPASILIFRFEVLKGDASLKILNTKHKRAQDIPRLMFPHASPAYTAFHCTTRMAWHGPQTCSAPQVDPDFLRRRVRPFFCLCSIEEGRLPFSSVLFSASYHSMVENQGAWSNHNLGLVNPAAFERTLYARKGE